MDVFTYSQGAPRVFSFLATVLFGCFNSSHLLSAHAVPTPFGKHRIPNLFVLFLLCVSLSIFFINGFYQLTVSAKENLWPFAPF